MSDDAIAAIYLDGARQSLEQYHSRRSLEYSISIPFWTGLGLVGYGVWSERVPQGAELAVALLVSLGLYGAFLYNVQKSQRRDLALTFNHRRAAVKRALELAWIEQRKPDWTEDALLEAAKGKWKQLGIERRKAAPWMWMIGPPLGFAALLVVAIVALSPPPRRDDGAGALLQRQIDTLRLALNLHVSAQTRNGEQPRWSPLPDPNRRK